MPSAFDALTRVLKELNDTGRVKASIVATDEGFVIASAVRAGVDENVAAAMGSFVHNAAERAREELSLGGIRDITIRCQLGTLVCKGTDLEDGRTVVFAALVPRENRFFLRVINHAVRKVKEALIQLQV